MAAKNDAAFEAQLKRTCSALDFFHLKTTT
jgi:hypothetical protein